jgi:hypothetical protein
MGCAVPEFTSGPVHSQGNGTMQIIVDERAKPDQRDALVRIMQGKDTQDMATMWWVTTQ